MHTSKVECVRNTMSASINFLDTSKWVYSSNKLLKINDALAVVGN